MRKCLECSKEFKANYPNQKYCSIKCHKIGKKKKVKEWKEKNPNYYKEYNKKYYWKHRGEILQQNKEYYKKNKERIKQYNQRQEVKTKKREYNKEYNTRPEIKLRIREHRQKPEVKKRIKERENRPEVKEHIKQYHKGYYKKNKEKINSKHKKYRQKVDTIVRRKYEREYYWKNKDKIKLRKKKWINKNRDKVRIIKRKTTSKKRLIINGFIGTDGITKQTQIQVWGECNGSCVYCKRLTNPDLPVTNPLQTTYDHIQEVNHLNPYIHLFDPNSIINLVIACRGCNTRRHNKPILKWCNQIGFIPELIKQKLVQQKEQIKLV